MLELEGDFLTKGFDKKEVQSYYKYMVNNAIIFGANKERAEQELKESLEFEAKLAKVRCFCFSYFVTALPNNSIFAELYFIPDFTIRVA